MSWADGEEDKHGDSGRDVEQHSVAAHGCAGKEIYSSEEEYVPRRDRMPFGCLLGKTGLETPTRVLIVWVSLGPAASTVCLLASHGAEGSPGPLRQQAGMGADWSRYCWPCLAPILATPETVPIPCPVPLAHVFILVHP